MTRVLVLGAAGMLGHKLVQHLGADAVFDVAGTLRREIPDQLRRLFPRTRFYPDVAAEDLGGIAGVLEDWRPSFVLNCIGVIKQSEAAQNPITSIKVNALFPHQLARLAAEKSGKLIHFSTDCVFSGARGNYTEDDTPDPVDLYGRSKLLGETTVAGALTLRTSIVGRELRGHLGLVDWFLGQRNGRVNGFTRALYSGLTTRAMAELIIRIIQSHPTLHGVWQVSSEPISKFELLELVNRQYELGIDIGRDESFVSDRRLDSSRFRAHTGWQPRSWEAMITDMRDEEWMYDRMAA